MITLRMRNIHNNYSYAWPGASTSFRPLMHIDGSPKIVSSKIINTREAGANSAEGLTVSGERAKHSQLCKRSVAVIGVSASAAHYG